MKFHPFANVFPLMSDGELKELAADIEAHGQREPIYVFEGQILDGRNRFNACTMAKRQPWIEPWEGNDPVAFVVSMNVRRRQLNESQRAIVAAKLAVLKQGRKPLCSGGDTAQVVTRKASLKAPIGAFDREAADMTISQASKLLNVGCRSVERAREVLQHGDEALVEAVEAGQVSVTDAARVVDKPKPIQQAALDAVRAGDAKTLVKAAKRLEPREELKGTSAVDPCAGRKREEEATVVIRRIELEYNRERIRSLRRRVRNFDPSCDPSYFREQFKELLTLINELDDFVTRHLDVQPEAFP